MGYKLYRAEIKGVDAPNGIVLISKDRLSKKSAIKWIPIDKYVWIAKEIKNDVGWIKRYSVNHIETAALCTTVFGSQS